MYKLKVLVVGLLAALPVLIWTVGVDAQSFKSGDYIQVAAGQTVDSTLYAAGKTIDIAGTVNGDVFCGAQTVTINGTVNGDVICAAQTITISGRINGSVRLAAMTIALNGEVNRNATLAAQSISTDSRSRITGDLTMLAQSTILNGTLGRDVTGSSENLTVNGTVNRNISADIVSLTLGNTAQVGGGVYYTSENQLHRQDGARVAGEIKQTVREDTSDEAAWIGISWWYVLSMVILALALVLIAPRLFQTGSNQARASLGMTFLVGFTASIVAPIAVITMFISIVGIPLGLLALGCWLVILGLSGPFAAYLTGRLIWRKGTNAILIMLLGTMVLVVLTLVPILNIFVFLAVMWFGTGMALRLDAQLLGPTNYHVAPLTPALATTRPIEPATLAKSKPAAKAKSARKKNTEQ